MIKMKITALTSCCVDFFPEEGNVFVGGNSLNFATQCKLNGINNVSVVGAVGNDKFGRLIEKHLEKTKINMSHFYKIDAPTASNRIYIDEKGDRYFKADSWQGGAFDVFRLSEDDWSFIADSSIIAMPAGDPNLKELLKRRNDRHLVVIDFLDYLGIDYIKRYIKDIDIVFLSGRHEILDELSELSVRFGKIIVATLGAQGSIAFIGGKRIYCLAKQVKNIVDTTGCGDAFQAAFTIEWLKTKNIEKSLYAGSLAASKVLAFMGGVQ